LVAQVALLGLIRLQEILTRILDVDERPSEVVSCADASEPGSFGGKTCRAVKVSCCLLNARELIYIVDGFIWIGPTKQLDVLLDSGGGGNLVERVH
jgi:hypothetical protein